MSNFINYIVHFTKSPEKKPDRYTLLVVLGVVALTVGIHLAGWDNV